MTTNIMDTKEKQELATIVATVVCESLNTQVSTWAAEHEEHKRILKGKNGDPSLPELVRNNADQIKETNSRIKQLYAGIGVVIGALVVEFMAWLVPRLLTLP